MPITDQLNKQIPEYYSSMYLDGYNPNEILYAKRRQMFNQTAPEEEITIRPITLRSEVYINGKRQ